MFLLIYKFDNSTEFIKFIFPAGAAHAANVCQEQAIAQTAKALLMFFYP